MRRYLPYFLVLLTFCFVMASNWGTFRIHPDLMLQGADGLSVSPHYEREMEPRKLEGGF